MKNVLAEVVYIAIVPETVRVVSPFSCIHKLCHIQYINNEQYILVDSAHTLLLVENSLLPIQLIFDLWGERGGREGGGFFTFFWVQKTKKKSQNGHFWHLLFLFFKIPYNLKIPYEWQPWQHRSSNIAYVSAFVNTNPHMKFQKNKKSGSKVTEGDGQTDRRTTGPPDHQTTRLL